MTRREWTVGLPIVAARLLCHVGYCGGTGLAVFVPSIGGVLP